MSKKHYDPKKAHDYYERTKNLKGRSGSSHTPPKAGVGSRVVDSNAPNSTVHVPTARTKRQVSSSVSITAAKQRVGRMQVAVKKLEGALSEARAALVAKRAAAKKTAKANSDGKSTAKEKLASKKYRDKNKTKLATAGSGSSSSTSSISSMSTTELEARIIKIQSALADAKHQLSDAQQQLGQLAHSAITSEPMFQENLARFLSAERRPSA